MTKGVDRLRSEWINQCEEYILRSRETAIKSFWGMAEIIPEEAEAYLNQHRGQTFHEQLFAFIDRTGKSDSDVYKKGNIDRRLFSKIRNRDYIPAKKTVIALCLALGLNRADADLLLQSAGYSLSKSDDYDLTIAFCLEKQIYDIFDINEILYHFGFETF